MDVVSDLTSHLPAEVDQVVAVASVVAVVALVTEVAVEVAEVSTPLTGASLFPLRTSP